MSVADTFHRAFHAHGPVKLPQFLPGNDAAPLPRWTDGELLRQLGAHAAVPDALFDEGQLDRLEQLAGARVPRRKSGAWWSADRFRVLELVQLARLHLSAVPPSSSQVAA